MELKMFTYTLWVERIYELTLEELMNIVPKNTLPSQVKICSYTEEVFSERAESYYDTSVVHVEILLTKEEYEKRKAFKSKVEYILLHEIDYKKQEANKPWPDNSKAMYKPLTDFLGISLYVLALEGLATEDSIVDNIEKLYNYIYT